jgi:catechol 2,3-dioxygenase-like lactoylglutathione lyase family enzyme
MLDIIPGRVSNAATFPRGRVDRREKDIHMTERGPGRPHSVQMRRLAHCGLIVSDLDATRDFYTRVLGMREIARPASFKFAGTFFESNGVEIHAVVELEPGRARQITNIRPEGIEMAEGFWPHISLEVDDVNAAMSAVEREAVEIVGGPMLRSDQIKQFYVLDPDGYMLELWSQTDEVWGP